MNVEAILFDLDDTLIHQDATDDASIVTALRSTVRPDALTHRDEDLVKLVRTTGGNLWRAHPLFAYCRRIGISLGEGMWGRFANDDPGAEGLQAWAEEYRIVLWQAVLAELGLSGQVDPGSVSQAFMTERRSRHVFFPEALAVLEALKGRYRLGLVTNGASDLQGEKISGAGIAQYFDVVVISGAVGVGKPDPAIFDFALNPLNVTREACIMVGNSIESDIAGAVNAGLHPVWVNRNGSSNPIAHSHTEIASLTELPQLGA